MAVLNRNGIANYQYDTSLGNTCFGDQPKTGFNNNALVVSTDEYCGTGSGKITTVAAGTGPHLSFSDALFDEARWGDYSFAQPDPSGIGVWLATEYIPSAADQNPLDNWGTYVFEVNPFSFGQ